MAKTAVREREACASSEPNLLSSPQRLYECSCNLDELFLRGMLPGFIFIWK